MSGYDRNPYGPYGLGAVQVYDDSQMVGFVQINQYGGTNWYAWRTDEDAQDGWGFVGAFESEDEAVAAGGGAS